MSSARLLFRRCYSTKSPQEILEMGFKQINQAKSKSAVSKDELMSAAKQLGIQSQVQDIYESLDVDVVSYNQMNPAQKELIDKADIEMFSVPPITEAHRPFEYDDLPSLGHLQLREHRVQREYNRIAAYDLPQLAKLAKPYNPPSDDKHVLSFRYFTFLGEEHPAATKVSVKFSPSKLGLDSIQKHKLCLLAGPRYNPEADIVTMSCSKFPEQAQNKRYLADTIKRLLDTAKDKESDTFEDVPLDTRHMIARNRRKKTLYPKYKFPAEWNRPQDAPQPKQDLISVIRRNYISVE